jgi:hypothetical protein
MARAGLGSFDHCESAHQEDFDIILESAAHNISLGHKHIVPRASLLCNCEMPPCLCWANLLWFASLAG